MRQSEYYHTITTTLLSRWDNPNTITRLLLFSLRSETIRILEYYVLHSYFIPASRWDNPNTVLQCLRDETIRIILPLYVLNPSLRGERIRIQNTITRFLHPRLWGETIWILLYDYNNPAFQVRQSEYYNTIATFLPSMWDNNNTTVLHDYFIPVLEVRQCANYTTILIPAFKVRKSYFVLITSESERRDNPLTSRFWHPCLRSE